MGLSGTIKKAELLQNWSGKAGEGSTLNETTGKSQSFKIIILPTIIGLAFKKALIIFMGISLMASSSIGRTKDNHRFAFDPIPNNFTVLNIWNIKGNSVVLVRYPNCTTFDGQKLLLIKGEYKVEKELDPHLLGGDHQVKARFEPNEQGLLMAKLCAENL